MSPFRLGLIAALSAIPATLCAAPAPDAAFTAFRTVCGDTKGDYAQVLSVSNADGWHDADILASPVNGVTVSDKLARTKEIDGGQLTLVATKGETKDGTRVATCTVYGDKGAFAASTAAARAWLGFDPQASDAASAAFHFASAGGKMQPVADEAGMNAAAASAEGMGVLTVKIDGDKTIIDEIKINK